MSSSDVGVGLFRELTATGAEMPYGLVSFETATAEATNEASPYAEGAAEFEQLLGDGAATPGGAASGESTFEQLVAAGYGPDYAAAALEALTAEATGLTGVAAQGVASFEQLSIAAESVAIGYAAGAGTFQLAVASAQDSRPTFAEGAATLHLTLGSASAVVGSAAVASVALEALEAEAAGVQPSFSAGAAEFERLAPYARSVAAQTLYRTYAMNVANEAVTEYQGFEYNSYAKVGGEYYAAGPAGLHKLTGISDMGDNINWAFRTGFHDDKRVELKRLEEVLLSIRFDGPIRLRAWTDENTYFDYNVANHRANVLHQVRAKLGRGLRSRFYRIEVFGLANAHAEVVNMTVPMTNTTRRVG